MSGLIYHWKKVSTGSMFGRTGTGPRPTDDLTVPTRDAVFSWQIKGDDFARITADTLFQAKIVETNHYARSVLSSCHKTGVINEQTGHPDTTRIDKAMVSKIAIISVPKQRELVNLLFFWEEEIQRMRLLNEEEEEIKGRIATGLLNQDESTHASEALRVVEAKKRVPPSLRDDSGKPLDEALPGYDG